MKPGKLNVTVWCPSVRLSVCPFFLTLIERAGRTQRDSSGAACDAASVHFGPTIWKTDVVVKQAFMSHI